MDSFKDKFLEYIYQLQDKICNEVEARDNRAKFIEDLWDRPEGGGGRTRVLSEGGVFEKGGVNVSAVHGELPKLMRDKLGVDQADFFACGLSLVLHPNNPHVPTVHANWRYFEMYDDRGQIADSWFGGGQDLTPYYLYDEDAIHFHQTCKNACDKSDLDYYSRFKKQCDEYFWNTHRSEARGVGGLFFDYLKKSDQKSMQNHFDFVKFVGDSFLESYLPIVEKRNELPFSSDQRDWQEIRRGRYVEFNLVHDRGTIFGLKTNGRIESILMSLPPKVQWRYDFQAKPNSPESYLLEVLASPKDWLKLDSSENIA